MAVVDALEWCIRQQGVEDTDHYLDDFLTVGPPISDVCQENLDTIRRVCGSLGVPLAAGKTEGPSSFSRSLVLN